MSLSRLDVFLILSSVDEYIYIVDNLCDPTDSIKQELLSDLRKLRKKLSLVVDLDDSLFSTF